MVNTFQAIKEGDTVIRMLAGTIEMKLKVTKVDALIHCGWWTFSRLNGAEIDEELGWNERKTGSFLIAPAMSIPEYLERTDEDF